MSCVFTPGLDETEIPANLVKERWNQLEFKTRTLLNNLCRCATAEEIPEETMHFLQFIVHVGSPIPASFLLPSENKMIKFQIGPSRIRAQNNPRDVFLIVMCFFITKQIVMRMFFKPLKLA